MVNYETFCSNPSRELARIATWLGSDFEEVQRTLAEEDTISPGHPVGGNRMRKQPVTTIEPDFEWRQKLPASDRALYQALTFGGTFGP